MRNEHDVDRIDDPARANEIRSVLLRKYGLRSLYQEIYARYQSSLSQTPQQGVPIELGAGAEFDGDALLRGLAERGLVAGVDFLVERPEAVLP